MDGVDLTSPGAGYVSTDTVLSLRSVVCSKLRLHWSLSTARLAWLKTWRRLTLRR